MDRRNIQEYKREIPAGIKIISIFYYICGLASAIYFLVNIFFLIWISINYPSFNAHTENLSNLTSIFSVPDLRMFIGYLVISLILAVIFFILAKNLWKLKPWARISSMNLSIIAVIYSIFKIITRVFDISYVIVGGGFAMIIAHLGLNEKVKEAFRS